MQLKPSKVPRPQGNARILSDSDRSVLEQAAKILNQPVTQWLGPGHGSNLLTGELETSHTQPDSQGLPTSTAYLGYPNFWTMEHPNMNNGAINLNMNVSLHDPTRYDIGPADVSLSGAAPSIHVRTGTTASWTNPAEDFNLGDVGPSISNGRSTPTQQDLAEDDFDGQQWENVQIPTVPHITAPTDPSAADYIWLSGDTELKDLHIDVAAPLALEQHSRPVLGGEQSDETRRPQNRRGPFKTPALREQTSNTRKLKACVRCRMQRIRCVIDEDDPTGECMTCKAVQDPRLHTLPCARFKITECTLYRTGRAPGLEFTSRWPTMKLKDINKWASTDVREIEVLSDVCPVPLRFKVRRFVPMPGDSLKRGWMDGKVKKFVLTTPFALVNMAQAVKDLKEYIDAHVLECITTFTKGADELIQQTYTFAIKYMERHRDSEEGLFLANFFRLWFAIRRTHTLEHISGEDTLDMRPEAHNKTYPWSSKVPLPPVMIQQLDMVLTLGVLQPLRKKFLEDLQRHIASRTSSSWMLVYLTIFMGSHGCAVTTSENYNSARRHGLKRRYAMPNFVSERHHAANVYLSHYHYCTQQYKTDPFRMEWRRRQATAFADLTPNEIHFLMKTRKLVEERQERFKVNHDEHLYEDEFYWVSQMYERHWQPRDTHIDFDEGTINDVPLHEYV